MTSKASISVVDDLRRRLAEIEEHQAVLLSERSELSYSAIVESDKASIKRVTEINSELAALTSSAETLEPALREAVRREGVAREKEIAAKRRDDARTADALLSEAEDIAKALDAALKTVGETAVAFEKTMLKIRNLSGEVTPRYDAIRVFMVRALRTAVHRGPLHIDAISPAEQTTVSLVMTSWARSIRGWVARTLDTKTTAKEAA